MWRMMLAVFAWPVVVALIASAVLWYRAEFPGQPTDRLLDPIQSRTARLSAEHALERFHELPSVEQDRFMHGLRAALQSTDAWIDDLQSSNFRILCLGEQHEPSTRRFLATTLFADYEVDTLLIEATPRELERIEGWLRDGRDYIPLLGADIGAILRAVRERNPAVSVRAIEETRDQAEARVGTEGSRDRSLVRNFWRAWQPGQRNIILYGALHCSSKGMWLYNLLREQVPPREDVPMRNMRVLGTEQHVPTHAFVHFLGTLRMGGDDFVVPDTDALPDEVATWFPFLDENVLSRYDTFVVFHRTREK